MTGKQKYLLPIALLGLVLMPVLLLLGLQAGQQVLKKYRVERFAQENLLMVVVPEASVIWEEAGRELRIGGRYFDVVHLKRSDGQLYLTGHFDEMETAVWQALQQVMGKQGWAVLGRLLLLLQCLPPFLLLRFALPQLAAILVWVPYRARSLPFSLLLPPFHPPRQSRTFTGLPPAV